jgi:O-antigen/teichoic acid export membrane protein
MSRLHKAAKATMAAQAFNWIGLALSLATVPLYLKWLGQERYGLLLTGLAFASYLRFSDAGINWASMLLIAQANGREDRAKISSIVRNSFSLAACSAVVVMVMVAALLHLLQEPGSGSWLPPHPEFPGLLLVIGLSVIFTLGVSPFYNLLTGLQETHLALIYQGSGQLLGTFAALAIASTHAPLGWVFAGNVAGTILTGLAAAIHCHYRHRWAFASGSLWEPAQIHQQLRTGAKSFAMQAGNVLWGTAPVLAISSCAGAQFVPYYSIPLTLLNAPLGVLSTFSASLQPGYGEAMGRGEQAWVAATVRRILRQVLLVTGLLGCGFLLLAGPFVHLWTDGHIELSPVMLANVFVVAAVGALLTPLRCAVTGINRHRQAALGDLCCGVMAMALSVIVVSRFGYEWVGVALLVSVCATNGWILPRELGKALECPGMRPDSSFWKRWIVVTGLAVITGYGMHQFTAFLPIWGSILLTALSIVATFSVAASSLMPAEFEILQVILAKLTHGPKIPHP